MRPDLAKGWHCQQEAGIALTASRTSGPHARSHRYGSDMAYAPKPTARLVATAWLLIGGGLLAPIGWIALVAGVAVAGVAAFRRAAARDARP